MRLRVVRFSQPVEGGVIKVPLEGTTRSGFDFDIDKLYMMKYQYEIGRKRLSNSQITKIWDAFYHTDQGKVFANEFRKYIEEQNSDEDRKLIDEFRHNYNPSEQELEEYTEGLSQSRAIDQASQTKRDRYEEYRKVWDQVAARINSNITVDQAFNIGMNRLNIKRDQVITSKYDVRKSPLENSASARNNMLINIIMARQEDPETFDMRQTPGGFEHPRKSAKLMRTLTGLNNSRFEKNEKLSDIVLHDAYGNVRIDHSKLQEFVGKDSDPDFDYTDPWTMILYNQQNQVAAKLVGIFANQNSNVRLCSLMQKLQLV